MKKKHALALILALFTLLATGCAAQKDGQTTIVTSFYPMYVLTLNVTDGVDGVTVQNMAEQNVGCLHDYQLQTRDMVALEGADALVINGGGMEQFMDKVISLRADLPVIDASEGIEMFPSDEEHDHDAHGHDDHDELYNAHVWLDPENAIYEMKNIKDAFCAKDASNSAYYESRYEECEKKADKLIDDYKAASKDFKNRTLITSHAAFSYLCDAFNMSQLAIEGSNGESDPSPAKMAEIIDFIKTNDIKYIFYESLDSSKTVDSIANETGAQTLALSPFEGDTDGKDYFTVMEENLETLKKAMN